MSDVFDPIYAELQARNDKMKRVVDSTSKTRPVGIGLIIAGFALLVANTIWFHDVKVLVASAILYLGSIVLSVWNISRLWGCYEDIGYSKGAIAVLKLLAEKIETDLKKNG